MTDERIHIRNWDAFQHYKDRQPLWIKNYTELLADDAYLGLSGHRRSILHGLWLAYASSRCRLTLDTRLLSRRLNLRVTMSDLEALNHAGFILLPASRPLADRSDPASPRARPRARVDRDRDRDREQPVPEPEPVPNFVGAGAGSGIDEDDDEERFSIPEPIDPHTVLRGVT